MKVKTFRPKFFVPSIFVPSIFKLKERILYPCMKMSDVCCICGYTALKRNTVVRHQRSCKQHLITQALKQSEAASELNALRARIDEKEARINQMEIQMAEQKEQMAVKDRQIEQLIKTNPPNRPMTTKRKRMTEPQRRKIALRQNFKCANPDGECKLIDGNLKEYDVDHVDPLFLGGPDDESNMQALCPACHRRKTERDALQARQVGLTEKL